MIKELRILVADDAGVMRQLITHWLNKMVYCRVTQAPDGLEAIRAIHEATEANTPFDLIVTDMNMPHVDGLRLVEYVRQKIGDQKTPIIVVSTIAGKEMRERAMDLGANAWITKPLKYFELLRTLLKLFGTSYPVHEKPAVVH